MVSGDDSPVRPRRAKKSSLHEAASRSDNVSRNERERAQSFQTHADFVVLQDRQWSESACALEGVAAHELSLIAPGEAEQSAPRIDHPFRDTEAKAALAEAQQEGSQHRSTLQRGHDVSSRISRELTVGMQEEENVAGRRGSTFVHLKGPPS